MWGGAKYTQEEFNTLLEGKLSTGEKIPIFKYDQIENGVKDLPHRYAIVLPFELCEESGSFSNSTISSPLAISRVGGKEVFEKLGNLKARYLTESLRCLHPYDDYTFEPSQPPLGRLLFVGTGYNGDLIGYISLSGSPSGRPSRINGGKFVGVSKQKGMGQ